MTQYTDALDGITTEKLAGFFEGWPNPPSPETHLRLLEGSDEIVLAIDDDGEKVVGFITTITDVVLSAYIPFLEVLPEYRGRGIGRELVRRMLEKLNQFYMVDAVCDTELNGFYGEFGMKPWNAVIVRRRDRLSLD